MQSSFYLQHSCSLGLQYISWTFSGCPIVTIFCCTLSNKCERVHEFLYDRCLTSVAVERVSNRLF